MTLLAGRVVFTDRRRPATFVVFLSASCPRTTADWLQLSPAKLGGFAVFALSPILRVFVAKTKRPSDQPYVRQPRVR